MKDGIKDTHRESIVIAFVCNNRVERAVLYGSRAMGTYKISSDIDIVLFGDQLTLTDHAQLTATIDQTPMAQSVDLVLHSSIQNRALLEHIRRYGVEWYVQPLTEPDSD